MLNFLVAPTNELSEPRRARAFCDFELKRLAAITSAKRRDEYTAGHQLIRMAASQALGVNTQNEVWIQPENSAPQLAQHPHLSFGLSHSLGWVAALVERAETRETPRKKVGLDIELERDRKNLQQLASYSFTQAWLQLHQHNLHAAFFQRWTLCEALVKGSQNTLGTALLRHQHFVTESSNSTDHWLYHARLDTGQLGSAQQTHLTLGPTKALHVCLCSETYHHPKDILGFTLRDGVLIALDDIEFSVFRAPPR